MHRLHCWQTAVSLIGSLVDNSVILNVVSLQEAPAKKGFIRGSSILTGYIGKKYDDGCVLTYVTQGDMKGTPYCIMSVDLCLADTPTLVGSLVGDVSHPPPSPPPPFPS